MKKLYKPVDVGSFSRPPFWPGGASLRSPEIWNLTPDFRLLVLQVTFCSPDQASS